MIWDPDTCYCRIECIRPRENGKFVRRCRVHINSRATVDVYLHNIANQERTSLPANQRDNKKHATRESTRP